MHVIHYFLWREDTDTAGCLLLVEHGIIALVSVELRHCRDGVDYRLGDVLRVLTGYCLMLPYPCCRVIGYPFPFLPFPVEVLILNILLYHSLVIELDGVA